MAHVSDFLTPADLQKISNLQIVARQVVEGVAAGDLLGDELRGGQLGQRLAGGPGRQAGQGGGGRGRDVRAGMHAQQPEHPCRLVA